MASFTPVIPAGMEIYYDDYQFAPAVQVGEMLLVSGQLGIGEDGTIPEDVATQMNNAFQAIGQILASAGMDFTHVISIDSFHVGDMHEQFEIMIGEKAKFIPAPHPAWTAVAVAGLALPEAKVEIKVTAKA